MIRSHKPKMLIVLLLVVGFLTATYGLTAANTVPASKAGDGSGAVSGYTVSGVDYTLLAADPTKLDKVDFDLDADPGADGEVKVKISGTWYDCTFVTTAATCDFPAGSEPGVLPATSLQVVVAE